MRSSGASARRSCQGHTRPGSPPTESPKVRLSSAPWASSETSQPSPRRRRAEPRRERHIKGGHSLPRIAMADLDGSGEVGWGAWGCMPSIVGSRRPRFSAASPASTRFHPHRAVLELGDLAVWVDRVVRQQVGCGLDVGKRDEHHATLHAVVGASRQLNGAAPRMRAGSLVGSARCRCRECVGSRPCPAESWRARRWRKRVRSERRGSTSTMRVPHCAAFFIQVAATGWLDEGLAPMMSTKSA